MIKECKVLLNNEAVTVIQYDDIQVQIPAIGRKATVIKVKDDGHYTVVPDDYTEPEQAKEAPAKKARKKKTPVVLGEAPAREED